jgi:uncharacterized protein YgiM (DUF1202 family)
MIKNINLIYLVLVLLNLTLSICTAQQGPIPGIGPSSEDQGRSWSPEIGSSVPIDSESITLMNSYPETATNFNIGDKVRTTHSNKLNVRTKPGLNSPIIDSMAKGSKGTVIDGPRSADNLKWWKISYDAGITGWSSGKWLELAPISIQFNVGDRIETTTNLNVRSSPGVNSPVIDAMAKGSKGTIIEGPSIANNLNWWKINYDAGITGWSSGKWLKKCEVCYTVKVISNVRNTAVSNAEIYVGDKYFGKTDSQGRLDLPKYPLGGPLGSAGIVQVDVKAKLKCSEGGYASGSKYTSFGTCTEIVIKIGECGQSITN